ADYGCAHALVGHVGYLQVQSPPRLVALFALGHEPLVAELFGPHDLCPCQCRPHASPTPVAPDRGQPVMAFTAVVVEDRVADHLAPGERDEAKLRAEGRAIDVQGSERLEARG